MQKFLIGLAIMGLAGPPSASARQADTAGWTVVDDATLRFEGRITASSETRFRELIGDEIKTIILTSRGGDVDAALKIAHEIHKRRIDTVIRGHCVSSCANYLFLAGSERTIEPDAFVGFHGTMTSLDLNAQISKMQAAAAEAGMGAEEVSAQAQSMRDDIGVLRQREQAFAETVGFDIALFRDSGFERLTSEQIDALPEGDPVFFPSSEILARCYRVTDVVDRSRATDDDLSTLGERGAPGLGFVVLGDEYFADCASDRHGPDHSAEHSS